jgi:hypothetical protein
VHSFGPSFGSASVLRGLLEPGTINHQPRPGDAGAGRFTPGPETWSPRGAAAARPHVVSNATHTADAHVNTRRSFEGGVAVASAPVGPLCAARNSPVVANSASRAEPGRHIPEQSDPRHTMQIVHYPNPQRSCLGCPLILSLPGNTAGDATLDGGGCKLACPTVGLCVADLAAPTPSSSESGRTIDLRRLCTPPRCLGFPATAVRNVPVQD